MTLVSDNKQYSVEISDEYLDTLIDQYGFDLLMYVRRQFSGIMEPTAMKSGEYEIDIDKKFDDEKITTTIVLKHKEN